MECDCVVELLEDKIRRDQNGQIVHHPLNGPYGFGPDEDMPGQGLLAFAGRDLSQSPLLEDCRVIYLSFYGEPYSIQDREAWADPLRSKVLQRLSHRDWSWYLSCEGNYLDDATPASFMPIVNELRRDVFADQPLNHTVIRSEHPFGFGSGFYPRLFFETRQEYLPQLVNCCWPRAIPTYPIQGYHMPSGLIDLLHEWDGRPRDDLLFQEVLDKVLVAFYTFPAEHRHFVFLTNKLGIDEMRELLDIESLQQDAEKLCEEMSTVWT